MEELRHGGSRCAGMSRRVSRRGGESVRMACGVVDVDLVGHGLSSDVDGVQGPGRDAAVAGAGGLSAVCRRQGGRQGAHGTGLAEMGSG